MENTEYPLTPFLDYAAPATHGLEAEDIGPIPWGRAAWGVEPLDGAHAPSGDYAGVGDDNPFVERGHDPA